MKRYSISHRGEFTGVVCVAEDEHTAIQFNCKDEEDGRRIAKAIPDLTADEMREKYPDNLTIWSDYMSEGEIDFDKKRFVVREKETGKERIWQYTKEDARRYLTEFEDEDRDNDRFIENRYEIIED